MNQALAVLIVDDEPPARRRMKAMLARLGIHRIEEASDAEEADRRFLATAPDVVLLDIEMRETSGLALAKRWAQRANVIFVTAHAQHAVEAFGVQAVDYLLKPVSEARLIQALQRVRPAPLSVHLGNRQQVLDRACVVRLEAAGDYTEFFVVDEKAPLLASGTLGHWETRLGSGFLRVHRRHIVHLTHARAYERSKAGHFLLLTSGEQVPVGRTYAARAQAHIEGDR